MRLRFAKARGQMSRVEGRSILAQDDRPLDSVAQLARVARSVMGHHAVKN